MFETEVTIEVVEKTPAKLMNKLGLEHTSELPT